MEKKLKNENIYKNNCFCLIKIIQKIKNLPANPKNGGIPPMDKMVVTAV